MLILKMDKYHVLYAHFNVKYIFKDSHNYISFISEIFVYCLMYTTVIRKRSYQNKKIW